MEYNEAVREEFELKVEHHLASAYSAAGIRSWWHRKRTALGGKTPLEIVNRPDFDPQDALSQTVLRLARELKGPGSAV